MWPAVQQLYEACQLPLSFYPRPNCTCPGQFSENVSVGHTFNRVTAFSGHCTSVHGPCHFVQGKEAVHQANHLPSASGNVSSSVSPKGLIRLREWPESNNHDSFSRKDTEHLTSKSECLGGGWGHKKRQIYFHLFQG